MPNLPEEHSAHVSIKPGFVWDECPAYLFDIDGTLLRSRDRTHFNAFHASVRRVTGLEVSLEGVPLAGNTDRAILRAAMQQSGIQEKIFNQHAEEILHAMGEIVDEKRAELDLEMLPGVEQTLAHLAARGAALGLATGNLEAIGWIKMERLGLRSRFSFGGFSDHFLDRNLLVGHAAELARQRAGVNATVCVVGDTPRDIAAARSNALPVIAVATGHYGYDELLQLNPEVCASSLADLLAATAAGETEA
jgi:phosphoglycolate phosphatase-like HAD superfamily hydrolase